MFFREERLQKVMNELIKLGFIGCGKMATAIIKGCLTSGEFSKDNIIESEVNEKSRLASKEALGIEIFDNNLDVVKKSDIVVFCVKPFVIKDVLKEVAPYIDENKLVISIAAGIKIETIKE